MHFTAVAVVGNTTGLSEVYKQKDTLAVFKPLPDVQGYPAAEYEQADLSDVGTCTLALGVSDQLMYSIGVSMNQDADKPHCVETAQKIAGLVITTMKGAR